jgi:hypothetical protein
MASTRNLTQPALDIEGHSVSHLLNVSKDVVTKKTANTVVLDTEAEGRIPKFAQPDGNGNTYPESMLTEFSSGT